MNLNGKDILVVGAGKTGISAVNFLVKKGASVTLNDKKILDRNSLGIDKSVKIIDGHHNREVFTSPELIILSPGIDRSSLPIPEGKDVIGDIELFYTFNSSKIVAITGTNGKTTTTHLTGEILKKKFKVFVGGNIGTPVFDTLIDGVNVDWSVLELSSFQLENIKDFYPDISVVLNITPDHLDRYKSFEDYVNAKLNIFKNQSGKEIILLNKRDEILNKLKLSGNVYWFDSEKFIKDGKLIVEYDNKKVSLEISKIRLLGKHFYEDIYAAAFVALVCGVEKSDIENIIYSFSGLEHRLEFVTEKNGVRFYNDSKSTTISSSCRAVESFAGDLILILGGIHKGEEFESFLKYKNIKKVICFGRAKDQIMRALKSINPIEVSSLDRAVESALSYAVSGDTILFSPGCSSFDMFQNYKERGRMFKELVK